MAKDLDFAVGQGEAFDGLVAHVGLDASSKSTAAVSKLLKVWENRQAQQAARAGGLGLMAVSLAACGGSSDDGGDDTDDDDSGSLISLFMIDGVDDIDTGADVVIGAIGASSGLAAQQLDLSTFEQGDAVAGDGATQLEIVVNDFGSISGSTVSTFTSPDATVSGVSSVVLVDENGADHLEFDMANFDGQVETITLETNVSASSFDVDVINFVADADTFTLAMNPLSDTVGNIDVIDAEMVVNVSLDHYTRLDANVGAQGGGVLGDNGASSVTLKPEATADVITLVAGAEGVAELFLDAIDTGFANSGPADVGPLTMDITASAAKQGEVELDLDYQATGATNTATVGDFEIVDFDVTLAKDSDGSHVTTSQELQESGNNGNVFNFNIFASVSALTSGTAAATVGDVTVSDIVVTGDLRAELEMISIDVDALVASGTGAATVGDMTVGDVTVTLSNDGNIELVEFAANAAFNGTSGSATVGDRTVGDVALTVGNAAEGVVFTNNAGATNAGTGAATVGSMTVGDITMTVGDNAVSSVAQYNLVNAQNATAQVGAATVGNVTVGDVSVTFGSGAFADALIQVVATASVAAGTGQDATVGNLTVGDVTFDAGATHQADLAITLGVSANAVGTGNAAAGNITIGNVSMSLGSTATSASITATLGGAVNADVGNATLGNASVGTISLVSGDGNNQGDAIAVYLAATVATTGDAVVGDVTVGMVSLDVGDNTGIDAVSLAVTAASAKGNATIGDVTFGGLTYTGDVSADLVYSAAVAASAASTTAAAVTATVGDVAYGSATATLNTSADSVDIRNVLDVNGQAAVAGAITVGDITVSVEEAVAATQNSHNVDILDIAVTATASGTLTVGAMTVGDITLSASHSNATVAAASIDVDILVDINFTGTGESIGDITVGDITATVGDLAHVDVVVSANASGVSLGAVTIGDVTVTGVDGSNTTLNADAVDFLVIMDSAEDVGAVTVGNIVLALADGQNGNVLVGVSVTDDSGDITIGNVTASVGDSGFFDMTVANIAGGTAGDITVGDISLTRTTDSANGAFDISIFAADGDITIGDITVSGAYYSGTTAPTNVDNGFTGIFALTVGPGNVTVGDIDYRGYESYAITTTGAGTAWTDYNVTIDFSGVTNGVANVYAAATDTTIIDNADGNNIYLGAGNDTVSLNTSNTGGLANASGSAATGTAASVSNKIYDIALGDVINFNQGDTLILQTIAAASYQAFLTAAEASITAALSVYIGKVGTTYYAAVDTNADGLLDVDNNDYIVMLDMTDAEAVAIDAAGGFIA